jgi:hypothetical protein
MTKEALSALTAFAAFVCPAFAASIQGAPVSGPDAVAAITSASYCFAHERALEVERLPPSYLVLQLHIRVGYQNTGSRPLIVPLGRERTVYTALKPGVMAVSEQPTNFPDDSYVKLMKQLPPDVSPDNPVNPANTVFTVIPAGGEMKPALDEELIFPVNHKRLFKHDPDLRGRRLYIRLQFDQQDLDPVLKASLSDRWTSFGVPWTGRLRTNTVTFDVPVTPPAAKPCVDTRVPEAFDGHLQTGNNR